MEEVWEILRREHIDGAELDPQVISDGAIRGMLRALDDPYAAYLNREHFSTETQDIQGFFEGIGAEVGMRDGRITIVAPILDTPAERAGIRPGDVILEIDGDSTLDITLIEAVARIRGQKGTKVKLLVQHLSAQEPELLEITRGVIPLESVRFSMLDGQIGHLRILNFTGTTNEELKEALVEFGRTDGLGLVLDLRNNPGGLLTGVVDATSQFLDGGLVLYQIDGDGGRTNWKVESGGRAKEIPMVVLVNEFSASASEVFTGAIMDHDRAIVIGMTTFGKGSVNIALPLSDGSGINFTSGRWFTPDGTLIEGEGIVPDIILENSEDDTEDLQLDRAVQILQEQLIRSG